MYSLLCLSLLTIYFFVRFWKGNGYGTRLGFILPVGEWGDAYVLYEVIP